MKRQFFFLLLLLLLVLQGACSFSYSYLVINSSKEPVMVELRLKSNPRSYAGAKFLSIYPRLTQLDALEKSDAVWQSVTATQMVRNDVKGEIIITLHPAEVLQVHIDSGSARRGSTEFFPIAGITLSGSKGRMVFEGDLVPKQFTEYRQHIYQIRYD